MEIIKRIKNSIEVRSLKLYRKIINTVKLQRLDRDSYVFLQMAVKWNGFDVVPYNFGDDLNVYLFEELTGKKVLKYDEYFHLSKSNYLGIGSIIEWCSTPHSIVWGSGAMYGDKNNRIKLGSVKALRGKYTKGYLEEFGIKCPNVFGDPALLLPLVYKPTNVEKKYKYGIVPHFVDFNTPQIQELCNKVDDLLVINLQKYDDWHEVINQFLSCECIVSSSLHGLIIADAYEIPNVRIKLSNNIFGGDFKFKDYYSGIGKTYQEGIDCSDFIDISTIDSALHGYQPIEFSPKNLLETFPLPLASRFQQIIED